MIASGGVSSVDDLSRLKDLEQDGVIGVIIGKALYEGAVKLGDAIRILSDDSLAGQRGGCDMDVKRVIPCLDVKKDE